MNKLISGPASRLVALSLAAVFIHAAAIGGPVPGKASDVVFSPRFPKDDSRAVADAFSATRVEWVYANDHGAVEATKALGLPFGLTLNANLRPKSDDGYAEDFDGKPYVAPWMAGWGAKWITTTHPATRAALAEELARLISLGATSIQFDDPLLQLFPAESGHGDFNPSTRKGFSIWLAQYPDRERIKVAGLDGFEGDYKDYLVKTFNVKDATDYRRRFRQFPSTEFWLAYVRSTVTDYLTDLRQALRTPGGGRTPLSMNLSELRWPDAKERHFFLARYADYVVAETTPIEKDDLILRSATLRALGLGFVPSIRPSGLSKNRSAIATLYALGAVPLVPWDIFVPNSSRYFGTPAEYADLFKFVRAHPDLFDDYVYSADLGILIDPASLSREQLRPLLKRLHELNVGYNFILIGPESQGRENIRHQLLAESKALINATNRTDQSIRYELSIPQTDGIPIYPIGEFLLEKLDNYRSIQTAPHAQQVHTVLRRHRSGSDHWVLHFINNALVTRENWPATSEDCIHRFIFRAPRTSPSESVWAIRWISPNGKRSIPFEASPSGALAFSLQDCVEWGIVEIARTTNGPRVHRQ